MPETQQGELTEATLVVLGSQLAVPHTAGVLQLEVYSTVDFYESGGYLKVFVDEAPEPDPEAPEGEPEPVEESYILAYSGKDDELNILYLIDALPVEVEAETEVLLHPRKSEKWAQVQLEDGEEAILARIPYALSAGVETGIRETGQYEAVEVELRDSEFVVVDFPGKEVYLDGSALDPTEVPKPPDEELGDAPVLTLFAGLDAIFAEWTEVASGAPVYYELHASVIAGFEPNEATLVWAGIGINQFVTQLPNGASLPTDAPTYFRVRGYNKTFVSPWSNEASATALPGFDWEIINQLNADLEAANAELETLQTVTLPQLNSDLATANGEITNLNTVVIPQLNNDLALANQELDQLALDITGLNGLFPIQGTSISDGAISTPKMVANTINGDRILANTLQAAKIVAGSITTDRFTANTVNGEIITAGTLYASKIVAGSITTDRFTSNTINGDIITGNTLNAGKIVAGTITTDRFTSNTINGDIIAGNTLHAAKITTYSIQADYIATDAIVARHILANQVSATHLTATAIDGKTITGALIRTQAGGRRVEISSNNDIRFYSNSGTMIGSIDPYDIGSAFGVVVRAGSTSMEMFGGGVRFKNTGTYQFHVDGKIIAGSGMNTAWISNPDGELNIYGNTSIGGIATMNSLADGGVSDGAFGAKYVRATTAGRLYASTNAPSAQWLKNTIQELSRADWKRQLDGLKPSTYYYNDDLNTWRAGFLAHETEQALGVGPFTSRDKLGRPDGIDYDGLHAFWAVVNQEQQREIDQLRSELDEIRALVA